MRPKVDSWSGFKKKSSIGDKYLTWYVYLLLGYALLGKGFAYLGFAPAYLGEITLALGLLVWLLNRYAMKVFGLLTAWFLAGFMLWGCIQTLPYLSRHGVDALRDAAVWGYGIFAFIIAALLIAKPERLRVLIDRYRWFIVLFAALMPVVLLLSLLYSEASPSIPGTSIPITDIKPGDVLVHLAGIVAFMLLGLGTANPILITMLFVSFALAAVANRGGTIAVLAAISLVALLRPLSGRVWRVLAISVLMIVVFGMSGVSVELPGQTRELSFDQLASNLQSVSSSEDSGTAALQGTKEWRLQWWDQIIGYTFYGDYFWTGKGFGINLANDDGYQVDLQDQSLRSPHNGHLTILARSGVPGLVLWALAQLSWVLGMLGGYRRSRLSGEGRWASLFLFLLAYWAAFMVNAAFDVFLEGPVGGIWFWTIYGVGLAAMWIYKCHPETLGGYQRHALVHNHYHQPDDKDMLSVPISDVASKRRARER